MVVIVVAHILTGFAIKLVEQALRMEAESIASTSPIDEGVVIAIVRPKKDGLHSFDEGKDHSLS